MRNQCCIVHFLQLSCFFVYLLQKAQSELAYELQASITKQKIKEEEMQIKVVERAQQINVQEQVIDCFFFLKITRS